MKRKSSSKLLIGIIYLVFFIYLNLEVVAAKEDTFKVDLSKSELEAEAKRLQLSGMFLVGEYLLEFSIFRIDVYKVSYYRSGSIEALSLKYFMDVSKNLSLEGWKEGFKWMGKDESKKYQKAVDWIFSNTKNVRKNDLFTMFKKGNLVVFKKNHKTISYIDSKDVAEIIFTPWIGKSPLREDVKKALLKNLNFIKKK